MIAPRRLVLALGAALASVSLGVPTVPSAAGPAPAATSALPAADRSATPAVPAALAEVQQVLDERVDAVRRGDRDAFLATVDPAAPPAFRLAQATSFEGLLSLPLEVYSLTARVDDTGDLGRGLRARYGGEATFLPETRMRMRFRDYDDRDDVQSLYLTFVKRAGRWFVANDADLVSVGLESFHGLWDQGPVEVQRTPHFLVLSHPADAPRAANLAAIAEEAIGLLDERWDQPWSHRVPLILPSSVDELARILQATFDLDNFVAFVSYGAIRDESWEPSAPRIYIQDRNLGRYRRDYQVRTLTHELNHVAVAALAGPLIPSWLHEGVADWLALGRATDERKPGGSDGRLPRDFEFTVGGSESINRSYAESRSFISFLASRAGLGAPGEIVRALGAERLAPGSEEYRVDQVLAKVAGAVTADLEKEWAAR
jgi:hypothetical protein